MQIEIDPRDHGMVVVSLRGRLDAAAAPTFKQSVTEAISRGNVRLALHIAHVSFMDSIGLGALVSTLKAARRANGDIAIAAPNPQVEKLLRLTAMDRVFRICPSPDEALRELGAGQA